MCFWIANWRCGINSMGSFNELHLPIEVVFAEAFDALKNDFVSTHSKTLFDSVQAVARRTKRETGNVKFLKGANLFLP